MKEEAFQKLVNRIDNGFVGDEEHVYKYQKTFAQLFKGRNRVLDIGCGKGAFLRALEETGVDYNGLDFDEENVKLVREKGYDIIHADAFAYLEEHPDFLGGVSMFHMIEHFDAETAIRLLVLIYDALEKDGLFCLITPDFADVGLHNFWLSSSHVRPYPLMWLENAFKEIGFEVTDSGKAEGGDTYIVGVKRHD